MNLRRIARQLGIHHRTVSLWVQAYAENEGPPVPEEVKEAELDELFIFIGDKKNRIYVITLVARRSRCFSRCPQGLHCAIKVFISCFNKRQLLKQRFPNYQAHVFQFVYAQ